ncbi:MAG: hypothetical protein NTU98_09025 [Bacteroidetes bacterium]|nr:hypothetical protein [Bacteroidota bacterium]
MDINLTRKQTTIFRYAVIPVAVLAIFIYFAFTEKGVVVYIVGFFCLLVIAASIAINKMAFKIPATTLFPAHLSGPSSEQHPIFKGVDGTVRLLSVIYLHRLINNYPQYEIKLLVTIPGKEPYECSMAKLGTPLMIMKMKVGAEFPAIIDEYDPYNINVKELEEYYSL